MRWFLVLLCVAVIVLARWSLFTVDAGEYAYVTVLGRHVATYDGSGDGAGLHLGWPWPIQSVQRLDRRLQQLDLGAREHLLGDPDGKTIDKTLTIEAYAVWKIAGANGVNTFVQRIGTIDRARAVLSSRIISDLGASLGKMKMDDFISTDQGRVEQKMQAWRDDFLKQLTGPLQEEFGIELLDVRLRRFNYQGEVRQAIFDRIRSERRKKVTEYLSEGDRLAKDIESKSDEFYRTKIAQSRFEEERLKGQADTEAMLIRNQAHVQDPEFYAFLKSMEKLQSILGDNKTLLLLSTHRPMFEMLFQPPRVEKKQ